jgi:hypothetical protein
MIGGVIGAVGTSLCCTGIPYALVMGGLVALYYATKPQPIRRSRRREIDDQDEV